MITEHDLEQAIAECQGVRNPNANTCIKLAAFLTLKREMFGDTEQPGYSFASAAPESVESPIIDKFSDSEFGEAVQGKSWSDVLPVIDELMSTLKIINRRLYDAAMRRL